MTEMEKEFLRVIKLFSDNNCLKHVVLIGSWAEYIYQNTGILPKGITALRTFDIDFLVKNLRLPQPPISVVALAIDEGFAVDSDILLGTTKIRTPSRLEVEFLINQKGAGSEPVYRTALGVTAQALRGLDLLLHETITADYFGIEITVPIPEAYILHKIIINRERNKEAKRDKDRDSIISLFPHLNQSKYMSLLENATKKKKKIIEDFWNQHR
jgi:hypothetical protein